MFEDLECARCHPNVIVFLKVYENKDNEYVFTPHGELIYLWLLSMDGLTVVLTFPSRNDVPSQLEYQDPQAFRDVYQTNYGEFAHLDPTLS